ncbi:MAG: molybdenum cofactor synthesis domain [Candidatus Aminicenantes bacterium]|jgi:molybdopterin molybdotransferase|nr:molybdenum cofactor synthesis domain [Candidatus Aminicenantes bacterium]
MIDYADALRRVVARAKPLPAESVPLTGSLGRTLAQNIRARAPIPPFAKATMDGYAVKAADTRPAEAGRPVTLEVVEDLPAGRISRKALGSGQSVRIMTGAPLPRGADAVVMVEDTEKAGFLVKIIRAVSPGDNIGRAGEDLEKGDLILEKGELIGPAEVGMLAALGLASVRVVRRPKLAVIATGDEIVEPGEKAGPGRIWNSNGYSLLSLALEAGTEARYLGIARDRASQLERKIQKAKDADILAISGGVSVGDYDLVKEELRRLGVRPVFWQLRIKPGKPTFFGVRGRQLVFGLPGNPTSAMVMFHLFVRPAIDLMLGRKRTGLPSARAVLEQEISVRPGRTQFLRGRLVGEGPVLRVEPFPDQRSGVLRSMVKSRVLIVMPADLPRLQKGREVEILFLD